MVLQGFGPSGILEYLFLVFVVKRLLALLWSQLGQDTLQILDVSIVQGISRAGKARIQADYIVKLSIEHLLYAPQVSGGVRGLGNLACRISACPRSPDRPT